MKEASSQVQSIHLTECLRRSSAASMQGPYEKMMIRRDDVLEVQKRFAELQGEAGYRQIAVGSVQQPSRKVVGWVPVAPTI